MFREAVFTAFNTTRGIFPRPPPEEVHDLRAGEQNAEPVRLKPNRGRCWAVGRFRGQPGSGQGFVKDPGLVQGDDAISRAGAPPVIRFFLRLPQCTQPAEFSDAAFKPSAPRSPSPLETGISGSESFRPRSGTLLRHRARSTMTRRYSSCRHGDRPPPEELFRSRYPSPSFPRSHCPRTPPRRWQNSSWT